MDPSAWLESNVPGYAALSQPERKAINDFSFLWSLFEGAHLDTEASATAIEAFVRGLPDIDRIDMDPFKPALTYFQNRYYTDQAFNDAFHSLMNNREKRHRPLLEGVLSEQFTDNVSVLSALLIIVYRLRNNLFHGTKWAYGIANQFDNFCYASKTLIAAMNLER